MLAVAGPARDDRAEGLGQLKHLAVRPVPLLGEARHDLRDGCRPRARRLRRPLPGQEVLDVHLERLRELQVVQAARVRPTPFDFAEEALGETGTLSERVLREPELGSPSANPLADVLATLVGRWRTWHGFGIHGSRPRRNAIAAPLGSLVCRMIKAAPV